MLEEELIKALKPFILIGILFFLHLCSKATDPVLNQPSSQPAQPAITQSAKPIHRWDEVHALRSEINAILLETESLLEGDQEDS